MMIRWFSCALCAILLTACNVSVPTPEPEPTAVVVQPTATTVVVQPTATATSGFNFPPPLFPPPPPPTLDLGPCVPIATINGVVAQRSALTARAQSALPNGQRLPNLAPRSVSSDGVVNDSVMVQFTDGTTDAQREQFFASINGTSREAIPVLNTWIVDVRGDAWQTVSYPAYVVSVEVEGEAVALQYGTPTDPRFGEQWAFNMLGLQNGFSGNRPTVTVAVIDSGICGNHPDLAGRIAEGFDFVDNDVNPQDEFGHGCGVAGVLAANISNGVGIAGIANNVQIMPLRVLDSRGLGGYSAIAQAIIYATDNGADIINLSLAGNRFSQILASAVQYALDNDVIVVAAAGNFNSDGTFSPAAFDGVISVGAVTPFVSRASFSNFGSNVDIYAPGQDILTTNMQNDFHMQSGTSFAAPIFSGLIALTHDFSTGRNSINDIEMLRIVQGGSCTP